MNNKFKLFVIGALLTGTLTACGANPELTQFRRDIDDFCEEIAEIDTAINNVNATSDTAVNEVLVKLDDLDSLFQDFAELDFPDEFDYLEPFADEAKDYMTTAVASYRDAYTNEAHDQYSMEAQFKYASENYSRAYKRVQIIIAILHGESPEDVGLVQTNTTAGDDSGDAANTETSNTAQ